MRFSIECSSFFVGQKKALDILALYAEEILLGKNNNFLFSAPSGYGKTYLAELFLEFLNPGFSDTLKYTPKSDKTLTIDKSKRFHFIDEVHNLREPESIYGLLSSQNYTFVLATNEYDLLKEPLTNRCETIYFEPYSLDELAKIIYFKFKEFELERIIPFRWAESISARSRGNPRVAKSLAERFCIFVRHNNSLLSNEALFNRELSRILGSMEGGFTTQDIQYLEALRSAGGQASLGLISSITSIPERHIRHEIEPFLISEGLIKIGNRGRTLVN